MKVVVRIIDKEWRTAAWRRSGCDVKWGCAGNHGRGAVHVIPGLGSYFHGGLGGVLRWFRPQPS